MEVVDSGVAVLVVEALEAEALAVVDSGVVVEFLDLAVE